MAPTDISMKQVAWIAAIALAAAALECGGSARSAPPPVTAADASQEEAAAGLVEHHRYHHHGGVTLLIAMSLDTLGVSPDEKDAVEKIRRDLRGRMDPARAAEQNLVTLLADGLGAGTIDLGKIDSAVAQLTNAAAAVPDASADALNQLHAVLTPPQRAALVDKVEAHWSVWQKANREETDRLADLTSDLNLAPDQVATIQANLGEGMKAVPRFDPQEVTAHIHAFGEAFKASTFDAKTLTTGGPATAHMVGWAGLHMARFIEAANPVLTPGQRIRLAQMLREHANHDPSAEGG
jgi:Spy/CpxP family protein refolding chaperone